MFILKGKKGESEKRKEKKGGMREDEMDCIT